MSDANAEHAELHSHSTASDGQFDPAHLARLVYEAGVRIWSLTDHDTCDGLAPAAAASASLGLDFIPGIEVSAQHNSRSVHVLGYHIDPTHQPFQDFLDERKDQRSSRMAAMVRKLHSLGLRVTLDHVLRIAQDASPARPHLARALVELGYVSSVEDAFNRYLGNDKPGYVNSPWPSVPEAIDAIHHAGGLAILAHPGLYQLDRLIPDWIAAGLDGIEIVHPKHDADARARYLRIAQHHSLLCTGGCDFHGPAVTPERDLGHTILPAAWLHALQERGRSF